MVVNVPDFYGLMWCNTCKKDVWADSKKVPGVRGYTLYSAYCPHCNKRLIKGW